MRSIAWVTDSTSTIDPEFAKENHIYIVPLRLILGQEIYKESIDISAEDFYEKMRHESKVSSSQPPIGEFIELYESLKEKYDDVIAIHCSSELSGTLNTSMQAAEIAEVPAVGIDSRFGAFPLREMVMAGISWHKLGHSIHEIKEKIETMVQNTSFYLIPANLHRLHSSGRVSGTQLLLSNLLRIHLLLRFEEGKVVVEEKIRTFKKAKQKMVETLKFDIQKIKKVCIMHANNEEEAKEIEKELSGLHPSLKTEIMTFIPVVGVHTGEGTLAMSWIKNQPSFS
ncbi:EDD domain protein, DegV family [Paenibacillus uliginis N3/975]|uniref:EDD domain protein, DegV family n=1 Tax=Paenibacillus uliginis N3/975 TaxID=1313296 RepID=A0A1X7HAN6_9BACL|nr:DegV family protein [Paenibacillus uliginis]SMF82626.1 EDD domain protein, DegV family [Paenibacillus uliginis N3/975]